MDISSSVNIIFMVVLGAVAAAMWIQKKKEEKEKNKELTGGAKAGAKRKPECNVESIEDFLDFDKIYNNMIIRKNNSMFTMVIHCSGINFDLMSADEKVMIEESFIELLNFLRFPVQLYVQTRKVDLKDSIKTYGSKIKSIEAEIKELAEEYEVNKSKPEPDQERMAILDYEIQRKVNLLEYAKDLKENIERMSINKNVLQYRYYIVLSYRVEEMGLITNFTEAEILDMAYTELVTRSQSIVGALMGCGIDSRILDSNALAELIYVAFNRDDAEIFRLKDNMEAGFYRLFSTTESAAVIKQSSPVTVEIGLDDQLLLINDRYDLQSLQEPEDKYFLESGDEKLAV